MNIKDYLGILLKRIWLIVLLPAVASMAAGYVSFFVFKPIYESSTTLYVINKDVDVSLPIAYNDLLAGQYLVKDYRELVKSRAVTSTVIEELKIEGLTTNALAEKITVNSRNDTRIIEIKVEDEKPERARDIADKLGEVFIEKVKQLMKVENVNIVDKAFIPEAPIKPKPYFNIAAAFVIGLAVAVGIAFMVEYLDDTIKTSEDVEKYLGLKVLGTIPVMDLK